MANYSPALKKAHEAQFKFALRNGSARLAIGGKDIPALMVSPPVTEAESRHGRARGMRRAIVGVLKSHLPTLPAPGTKAKLDGWACMVAEEGVEEEAFAWNLTLRSA